ncbi:MAG: amidohydrolase family protein [Ilumatobacteraceae bacterium]
MTPRIDAHHHVWDLAVRDQPWMTGEVMAPISRSFGIDEFTAQARPCGIAASVVVQTVTDISETEELLDLAAASPCVVGVVGWVDLAAADVGDRLDRLRARASGSLLVGIRSMVQYEPDPEWLGRPSVIAGLREVARRGLVNELLVLPHQLDAVSRAASEVTDCRFVLDHLAKPPIASAAWQPWAAQLAAVAEHENVTAKISGLVTEADWGRWTTQDVQPYLDHAVSVFGTHRLAFGSDWPVCTLAASYQQVVELAEDFICQLTPGEQAAILGGNAAEIYSLDKSLQEEP